MDERYGYSSRLQNQTPSMSHSGSRFANWAEEGWRRTLGHKEIRSLCRSIYLLLSNLNIFRAFVGENLAREHTIRQRPRHRICHQLLVDSTEQCVVKRAFSVQTVSCSQERKSVQETDLTPMSVCALVYSYIRS